MRGPFVFELRKRGAEKQHLKQKQDDDFLRKWAYSTQPTHYPGRKLRSEMGLQHTANTLSWKET